MVDNSKKILIIDDNTNLRECLKEILIIEGFDVQGANDGLNGLTTAVQFLPDLILCDIVIPIIDGYEVFHSLQKNDRTTHIRFVFLTSKSVPLDIRKEMELNGFDYLLKPFTMKEVLQAIKFQLEKQN